MLKKLIKISSAIIMITALFIVSSITVSAAAQMTPHGTARWASATATINTSNNSAKYQKIWNKAVKAWNRTGVFEFTLTSDSSAQINASTNTGLGGSFTGMTYITTGSDGYMQSVTSELNPQTLDVYDYSTSEKVNVAEHELGHAIGLLHNLNRASVMFAANRYYSIQKVDTQSVQQLYATQMDRVSMRNKKILFRDPVNVK